jgi:hypothetical protein
LPGSDSGVTCSVGFYMSTGELRERISAPTSMIRRYLAWRNRHAHDQRLSENVNWAKVA